MRNVKQFTETQPTLFNYGSGHSAGHAPACDTSAEGAAHANATLGDRQSAVYQIILRTGGATLFEIQAELKIKSANRVSGRITELRLQGLVCDSGKRRKNPETQLSGKVWRPVNPGEQVRQNNVNAMHTQNGRAK